MPDPFWLGYAPRAWLHVGQFTKEPNQGLAPTAFPGGHPWRWRLSLGARVTSGRRRWRRFLGVGFGKALPEAPPAGGPEASASGRSPPRGIFSGGGRGKGSAQASNQRPPPRRRAPQPSPPEARRSDGHREERKQLDSCLENSPVSSRRKPSTGRTENGRAPSPSPSLSLPHPSGRAAEETRSCLEICRSTASRRRASGLPSQERDHSHSFLGVQSELQTIGDPRGQNADRSSQNDRVDTGNAVDLHCPPEHSPLSLHAEAEQHNAGAAHLSLFSAGGLSRVGGHSPVSAPLPPDPLRNLAARRELAPPRAHGSVRSGQRDG